MEDLFIPFAQKVSFVIEVAAVLVIAFGAAEAFVRLFGLLVTSPYGHGDRKAVWRRFGTWLLFGLEFALAADIIESVLTPTWEDIGQLAAIAAIRTFLNYFLEKDLEKANDAERV